MDRRTAEKRLGQVLGKYTLVSVLGVGGMATVYRAAHRTGHKVAVKLLHPHLAGREDVCARFVREAYTANKIEHPGVVRVIDDDMAKDGAPFLVMELLEGETLDAWQERAGPKLPAEEVFAATFGVLDVLSRAHTKGIVHRDIKPENLFRTREGKIRVLDFGIARALDDEAPSKTRTGSLLGTPAFMPPEQAQGRTGEIDGRTDVWAVGATAFRLISGRFVHEAETVALLQIAAGTQQARSLAPFAPELPVELVAIVDKALKFEKGERWQGAREMQIALAGAFTRSFGRSPMSLEQVTLQAAPSRATEEGAEVVVSAPTVPPTLDGTVGPERGPGEPFKQTTRGRALGVAGGVALLLLGFGGVKLTFAPAAPTAAAGPPAAAIPPASAREPSPSSGATAFLDPPSSTPGKPPAAPRAGAPPVPSVAVVSVQNPRPAPPVKGVVAKASGGRDAKVRPAAPDCDPPFTIGHDGKEVVKPGC